jgi:hypothetical protein
MNGGIPQPGGVLQNPPNLPASQPSNKIPRQCGTTTSAMNRGAKTTERPTASRAIPDGSDIEH